ncbi:MAG: hypothetical protein AABZ43_06380 [Planctomycetota bacterium]
MHKKIVFKSILFFTLLFAFSISIFPLKSYAVPAYPGLFELKQPSGYAFEGLESVVMSGITGLRQRMDTAYTRTKRQVIGNIIRLILLQRKIQSAVQGVCRKRENESSLAR